MAYIGFNPVPNISLGDMENLFDIENELAIISDTDTKHSTATSIADKDKIAKQFMLNSVTDREIPSTDEDDTFNIELDDIVNTEETEETEETDLDFDIDDEELDDTDDEMELDINEDASFDIDEDDLVEDDTEEEIIEAVTIKPPAKQQAINIDRREEELLGRIKIAEENKRAAEEKRIRLNKLEEEALKAEQEALRIKELHEQERKQSEFIRKEQREKEDNKERLKQEEEKKEKLKRLIADKQKQEIIKNKQSRVDSINSTVSTETHNYDRYNSLDIDALYSEVREFLKINGVQKKATDTKILEAQFGKANIKKLILKSYLISLGKGVTIGK